jgi:hypothetical protein
MLTTLLATALLAQGAQSVYVQRDLSNPEGGKSRLFLWLLEDRLPTPKLSPKKFGVDGIRYEFDWLTPAFAFLDENTAPLRFRVFSQERKPTDDLAPQVARMALRLFDHNFHNLHIDHNRAFNDGVVDFYLCWGGKAGGEQLYDQELVKNRAVKVNTIYIYDLSSFTDPVEKAREIAHEYGHAALPPIGGFEQPEDWANGYLGEKIYLTWLRDGMAKGWFGPEDAMGANKEQLDKWIAANVEPHVTKMATNGPDAAALTGKGPAAMDAYLGLACYMHAILPGKSFMRAAQLTGSVRAPDYLTGVSLAVEEWSNRLTIPAYLVGKKIWVPISNGTVSGATILKRKGGWAQIQPGKGAVTIVPRNRDKGETFQPRRQDNADSTNRNLAFTGIGHPVRRAG